MLHVRPELYFALGQTALGLALLACLSIIPKYFFRLDQGGVSNYGTEAATKLLYVLGFGAAMLGTLLAAISLPKATSRRGQLRAALYVLAVLYLVVLLSTFSYKLSDSLRRLHDDSAIVLFTGMFVTALWLRFVAVKDIATKRAFLGLSLGLAVGVLTLAGMLHVLFAVQIVSGVAFALLLTHGIAVLRKRSGH